MNWWPHSLNLWAEEEQSPQCQELGPGKASGSGSRGSDCWGKPIPYHTQPPSLSILKRLSKYLAYQAAFKPIFQLPAEALMGQLPGSDHSPDEMKEHY